MNPQQLTTNKSNQDSTNQELQRIAMRTHLEIQQRDDIRRDLAASLKFIPADLIPGEEVYYWQDDPSKIKQGKKSGRWMKVRIIAVNGSMATINNGTAVMQVNSTKLRRPLEEIDLESADSRERANFTSYWQCHSHGPLDVLELFSGSTNLSAACSQHGLQTGAPIDIRTKRNIST